MSIIVFVVPSITETESRNLCVTYIRLEYGFTATPAAPLVR